MNILRQLASRRVMVVLTIGVWVLSACTMPLRCVSQARRQAHLQLMHVVSDGKPDASGVITAFDNATNDVIAAAFMPFPLLVAVMLFLVRQIYKLQSRCNALTHDLRLSQTMDADGDDD